MTKCTKVLPFVLSTRRPYNTANSRHWHDIGQLNEKTRDRLEWSNIKMLRILVTFINTQGWQVPVNSSACSTNEEEGDEVLVEILSAVDYISCFFKQPLEAKGVSMLALKGMELRKLWSIPESIYCCIVKSITRCDTKSTLLLTPPDGAIFCRLANYASACHSQMDMWKSSSQQ